jgi:hypothetical protein
MKKNQLFRFLTIGMLALGVVSCKKDDDAPPANQIEDASGIKTTLTWTHDDGSTAANSDIDITLYKGTGANKVPTAYFSDGSTAIETFNLISTLADGDYTITTETYNVSSAGKMNFSFDGLTAAKKYEIKGIVFTSAQANTERDLIKINKSGNKYTITPL